MVRYIVYPYLGNTFHKEVPLLEFVKDIPYLLTRPLIPPKRVLDHVLSTGKVFPGMSDGVQWEPFLLSREEYEDLVRELKKEHNCPWTVVNPPESIQSEEEWNAWLTKLFNGSKKEYDVIAGAYRSALDALNAAIQNRSENRDILQRKFAEMERIKDDFWVRLVRDHGA